MNDPAVCADPAFAGLVSKKQRMKMQGIMPGTNGMYDPNNPNGNYNNPNGGPMGGFNNGVPGSSSSGDPNNRVSQGYNMSFGLPGSVPQMQNGVPVHDPHDPAFAGTQPNFLNESDLKPASASRRGAVNTTIEQVMQVKDRSGGVQADGSAGTVLFVNDSITILPFSHVKQWFIYSTTFY